jgi:hypothetical protein
VRDGASSSRFSEIPKVVDSSFQPSTIATGRYSENN